jgi:hypothetical protein
LRNRKIDVKREYERKKTREKQEDIKEKMK